MIPKTRMMQARILRAFRRHVREDQEAFLKAMVRLFDAGRFQGEARFQTEEWRDLQDSIHRLGFERRFSRDYFKRERAK